MPRSRNRGLLLSSLLLPLGLAATPATGQCEYDTNDCNANGIPDACELAGTITLQSGAMGPLDSTTVQRYEIESPPVALSDLTVTCTARANLANWTERVDVWINDIPVRAIYLFASDCSPDAVETFILPAETYLEAMASGEVALYFEPSDAVDPDVCTVSSIDVAIQLTTYPGADENGNGVLDECESNTGPSLCEGFEPTIYVNEAGFVVGGPLNGRRYNGVLVGTPGSDVIMGTAGNDLIVTVGRAEDDRVCGNGGNDHVVREPQGQANGHANGQANRANGRRR